MGWLTAKADGTVFDLEISGRPSLFIPSRYSAWDGEEVARVGEGEEGGLVGSAELGDPDLAGGPVLPMKL